MRALPPLLSLVLLVAVLAAAQGQEERVAVILEARPEDCARSLEGAGQYMKYSQVMIRARPVSNCVFVGWEIVQGMDFYFTSANPFVFYAERDFRAVAVFERLYEGPEGVVDRVLISFGMNVSLPQGSSPEPVIARPGQRIRYVYPEEIPLGEQKYVFMYVEVNGARQDSPVVELQAPEKGVLNVNAYYYTYVRFLNEYYPLDQFVDVPAEVKTLSDSERMVPKSYRIGGYDFPLSQRVPRQLLGLVNIVYVRQYKVVLASNGAEPLIAVNEKTVRLAPTAHLWVDEGQTLFISYPERFEKYRLKSSWVQGLRPVGLAAVGNITGPVTLLLEYERIPNLEFLDTPYAGQILYGIAELGGRVAGVEGFPALMIGTAVILSAIAAPLSAIVLASSKLFSRSARAPPKAAHRERGVRGVIQPLLAAEEAGVSAEELEKHIRARGRIRLPSDVAELLRSVRSESEADEDGDTAGEIFRRIFYRREDELAELLRKLYNGNGVVEASPYLLCHIPWKPETLSAVKNRLRLKGDLGYACFEREGAAIISKLQDGATIVVESPDIELGVAVVERACRDAGLRAVRANISRTGIKEVAREVKRLAAGADAVIFTPPRGDVERDIARSSALTGLIHIIVSEKPTLAPGIKLRRPSAKEYVGIAAAVMAEHGLLDLLSMDSLTYLGEMAYGFNGLATLRRAAAHLSERAGRNRGLDVQEALRQIFKQELLKTFTPEELELINTVTTVEQLKRTYISLVRQLKPGADPTLELANLLERLRRLGWMEEG